MSAMTSLYPPVVLSLDVRISTFHARVVRILGEEQQLDRRLELRELARESLDLDMRVGAKVRVGQELARVGELLVLLLERRVRRHEVRQIAPLFGELRDLIAIREDLRLAHELIELGIPARQALQLFVREHGERSPLARAAKPTEGALYCSVYV
jgi:hypothetical protein